MCDTWMISSINMANRWVVKVKAKWLNSSCDVRATEMEWTQWSGGLRCLPRL